MKEKIKTWYNSNKEKIKSKAKKALIITGAIGSGVLIEQFGERVGIFKTCVVLKKNPEIFKEIGVDAKPLEDEANENG